jgi:hypothetical protein
MDLDELLEALNNSDAQAEMAELHDVMRTIDTVESEKDFRSNLNDAIHAAEELARTLNNLRREIG